MNVDTKDQATVAGADGAPRKPGRRRFASTGIKASGVILTLASSPGMAATVCRSPSGFMSGNLNSAPGEQAVSCVGRSPGYWKNWPQSWPGGCVATASKFQPATTFASVFPGGRTELYRTGTMMAVLTNNKRGQDPYNLGAHLVAAYLNVMSYKIDFLTVADLKGIWNDLCTYGYYSPMAGVRWGPEQVAKYLYRTET